MDVRNTGDSGERLVRGNSRVICGETKVRGKILANDWGAPSLPSPLGEALVPVFVLFILSNVSFTFT